MKKNFLEQVGDALVADYISSHKRRTLLSVSKSISTYYEVVEEGAAVPTSSSVPFVSSLRPKPRVLLEARAIVQKQMKGVRCVCQPANSNERDSVDLIVLIQPSSSSPLPSPSSAPKLNLSSRVPTVVLVPSLLSELPMRQGNGNTATNERYFRIQERHVVLASLPVYRSSLKIENQKDESSLLFFRDGLVDDDSRVSFGLVEVIMSAGTHPLAVNAVQGLCKQLQLKSTVTASSLGSTLQHGDGCDHRSERMGGVGMYTHLYWLWQSTLLHLEGKKGEGRNDSSLVEILSEVDVSAEMILFLDLAEYTSIYLYV